MRFIASLIAVVCVHSMAIGQIKEERSLGVRYNGEVYPQTSARETLGSFLRALDKERYDYMAAFLLDRAFVNEQLRITAPIYEKAANEKVEKEGLDKKGFDEAGIRARKRELATQSNFENLILRIKTKLAEDPEAIKDLRKLYRDGDFTEGADAAVVKHPDIKGRSLFFRNVSGRWYIENKLQE